MPIFSFSPGFLVGEASHSQHQDKSKDSKGGGTYQEDMEDGVPKVRPAPDTLLFWNNISQILKQKLTNKAFDEALPYVRPRPLPRAEGVDSAETFSVISKK